MTLDAEKDNAAKTFCLLVADQLETKKIAAQDAMNMMLLFGTGLQAAHSPEELRKYCEEDLKSKYPQFSKFTI